MLIYLYPLLVLVYLVFFPSYSWAQSQLNLDSVASVRQTTYNYKNGVEHLAIVKESVFDTNAILIRQHRYNYMKVDTGFAPRTHYSFTYNPVNKLGSYYTEQLTHSSKPKKKYSKQESKFKSYDHKFKREWVKLYKKNSRLLLRQTQKNFDKNGYTTQTKTTNYDTSPPNSSTEKVQRNALGNIVRWESFDDDGDTKMQARFFEAKYKEDSLLLQSSGYLYYNWNQLMHKYDRNRQIKKTISKVGTRSSTGKIKVTSQIITIYKNNQPFKQIEKKLHKTVKKVSYTFEPNKEIQHISTPEGNYKEIKTYTYLDSAQQLLSNYTETQEGKPFLEKRFTYDPTNQKMVSYIELEHRKNGKDWKTIKQYNSYGNYTQIDFYIADQLRKRDVYQYTYHPKPPKKED